ncbi:Rad33p NDAI_0C01000 [Naumovozyma dairenensis CBS 421]|uniref:DNA repair protein RAD33 n=1 Tax=Naumovozyma dairenensis (strain ATCC 10597 / BCRC 20456 / CBS 421 / NBRC 0211 / NRRL Y-12639) TaxID=1071378 RepID=G0W7K0_NAUDC|nr:hypothetical protein NDAI_0C01000 [Naumovozyma dairenensis CBS 421]CCD23761.1 hypothetical protein NDAI_0C01000 [Naumovozyma dairenensis CBS 421]
MAGHDNKTSAKVSQEQVDKFINATVPDEIEDEILNALVGFNLNHDMNTNDLNDFFELLQLPRDLYKLVPVDNVVVEGTNIIDFNKIVRATYELLIFLDNSEIINNLWQLMVTCSGRDKQYPHVILVNHILSVKDLQKIATFADLDQSSGIIQMMTCATSGKRVYMTYLDFAIILGKLGYLRF